MDIGITVERKCSRLNDRNTSIVCNNTDYTLSFAFDSEWNDFPEKTACFEYYSDGEFVHEEANFTGNTVAVPLLSGIYEVRVGVSAGDILTTTGVKIRCIPFPTDWGAERAAPMHDCYDMMMQALAYRENGDKEEFEREMAEIKKIYGGN